MARPLFASWDQDDRPAGAACFQIFMRLRGIGEGVAVVDVNLHLSAGDHVKHAAGPEDAVVGFQIIVGERRAGNK